MRFAVTVLRSGWQVVTTVVNADDECVARKYVQQQWAKKDGVKPKSRPVVHCERVAS